MKQSTALPQLNFLQRNQQKLKFHTKLYEKETATNINAGK